MALHQEIAFETDICNHLAQHGWLYGAPGAEGDASGYDTARALYPADLLTWVQQTQPQAWEVLAKNHGAAAPPCCSIACAARWTSAARSKSCVWA